MHVCVLSANNGFNRTGKNCFFMGLHFGYYFQLNWKMSLETHGTLMIYKPYFKNLSSKSCTKY